MILLLAIVMELHIAHCVSEGTDDITMTLCGRPDI